MQEHVEISNPWSSDREARLRLLRSQGLTIPRIAKIMNLTEGAVKGKLCRIGMLKPDEPISTLPPLPSELRRV